MTPLKAGDKVYRVESTCLDAPHPQFRVAWRTVAYVSPHQLRLVAPFSDVSGTVFRDVATALALLFFTTPEAAVEASKRKAARAKARGEGMIRDADVETAWADQWLSSRDKPVAAQRGRDV